MSKIILLSDLFDYYVIYGGSLIFMCGVFIDFLVTFHFIPLFFCNDFLQATIFGNQKKKEEATVKNWFVLYIQLWHVQQLFLIEIFFHTLKQ